MPERDVAPTFVVARNPEEGSKLGFLVRLPLPDGDVVLKTADTWPRTAKLYCHSADWPQAPQILEEVPVRSCRRRGVAIDLVLERPRENRAQFVFTTARGRDVIFWQSPKTTARSRPGVRIPTRRASGFEELTILIDTRERYPYRFAHQHVGGGEEARDQVGRRQVGCRHERAVGEGKAGQFRLRSDGAHKHAVDARALVPGLADLAGVVRGEE